VYSLKVVRLGIFRLSLQISNNMLTKAYSTVFSSNSDAPALSRLLLVAMLFDVGFNLSLIAMLVLVHLLLGERSRMDVVSHVVDYIACALLTLFAGMMVTDVVGGNRYFQYRDAGTRAINAMTEILFRVHATLLVIPYYAVGVIIKE
jgi:hypothetical protein